MSINVSGTTEAAHGRYRSAVQIFRELLGKLAVMEGVEIVYVESISAALWQAVALSETAMGLESEALTRDTAHT
jgi:hypothetical protein